MIIEQVNRDASNVPIAQIYNPSVVNVSKEPGASRYRYKWHGGELHALLLNKNSDILVVSFHGAVDRTTTNLPRFERLKTLSETEYSSLFIGDPTLYADGKFSLGWFTGWPAIDMQQLIARWIVQITEQLNIKHVILSGSSGGGFAAMQVSSFIPNSIALAFNAQTEIRKYRINGESFGAQQTYLRHVRPDLWSEMSTEERDEVLVDWDAEFDNRVSVVKRYSEPMHNYLLLVENDEEFHYEDHFLPLMRVLQKHQESGRFRCSTYPGGAVHNPPTLPIFMDRLNEAISWAKSIPSVSRVTIEKKGTASWFDLMARRVNLQDPSFDVRLNDKTYFEKFAKSHGIPIADSLRVIDTATSELSLPDISSMVVKPIASSSSQGVLILERQIDGEYKELRSGERISIEGVKTYYKEFYLKHPDQNQKVVVQRRIYDRGRYPIPRDFKFYVFGGQVGLVQCIDRNQKPVGVTWFDRNFEHITSEEISVNPKFQARVGFAKPDQSQQLIDLAEKIASAVGTAFLRVDLYLTPNGPVCGEVTFTPGGPYFELTDILSAGMQLRMGMAWQTNSPLQLHTPLEDKEPKDIGDVIQNEITRQT